jgi:DNA-binding TFAR19-related protein (PDSD5 family)
MSTTASHSGSHAHAQHIPWQLDLHPKVIQQQQQQQQQQQEQKQQLQQQQQQQQHPLTAQLATPCVERLLPIGTTRLGMFQNLYLTVVNLILCMISRM